MDLSNNTILITGGAAGIGFALAERFANAGSNVVICDRNQDSIDQAISKCPSITGIYCDVSQPENRMELFSKVSKQFPALNILINNAGVQYRLGSVTQYQDWSKHEDQIGTNLAAPIHLSLLFVPMLQKSVKPYIINITSGLAYVPLAFIPTYCATKAALHSFSISLRYQLSKTPIKVIEIAPPAVNTDLCEKGLHHYGESVDQFTDHVMVKLQADKEEFGYKLSEQTRLVGYDERERIFKERNAQIRE